MNKPLLAVAGLIAAGGTAAGVIVVASSGGEEEVVQQVETATAIATSFPTSGSSTAAPSSTAGRTPGPGETLFRWANLELLIPDGSGIRAGPGGAAFALSGRDFMLVKVEPEDSRITSTVVIDGDNGAILEEHVQNKHRAEIDGVLATLAIKSFDGTTAPWPYSGEPTPEMARENAGRFIYISPPPATGLYVGGGIGDPGGAFISLRNERSVAFVQQEPVTGELMLDSALVVEEDKPVFDRWLATVELCDAESAC